MELNSHMPVDTINQSNTPPTSRVQTQTPASASLDTLSSSTASAARNTSTTVHAGDQAYTLTANKPRSKEVEKTLAQLNALDQMFEQPATKQHKSKGRQILSTLHKYFIQPFKTAPEQATQINKALAAYNISTPKSLAAEYDTSAKSHSPSESTSADLLDDEIEPGYMSADQVAKAEKKLAAKEKELATSTEKTTTSPETSKSHSPSESTSADLPDDEIEPGYMSADQVAKAEKKRAAKEKELATSTEKTTMPVAEEVFDALHSNSLQDIPDSTSDEKEPVYSNYNIVLNKAKILDGKARIKEGIAQDATEQRPSLFQWLEENGISRFPPPPRTEAYYETARSTTDNLQPEKSLSNAAVTEDNTEDYNTAIDNAFNFLDGEAYNAEIGAEDVIDDTFNFLDEEITPSPQSSSSNLVRSSSMPSLSSHQNDDTVDGAETLNASTTNLYHASEAAISDSTPALDTNSNSNYKTIAGAQSLPDMLATRGSDKSLLSSIQESFKAKGFEFTLPPPPKSPPPAHDLTATLEPRSITASNTKDSTLTLQHAAASETVEPNDETDHVDQSASPEIYKEDDLKQEEPLQHRESPKRSSFRQRAKVAWQFLKSPITYLSDKLSKSKAKEEPVLEIGMPENIDHRLHLTSDFQNDFFNPTISSTEIKSLFSKHNSIGPTPAHTSENFTRASKSDLQHLHNNPVLASSTPITLKPVEATSDLNLTLPTLDQIDSEEANVDNPMYDSSEFATKAKSSSAPTSPTQTRKDIKLPPPPSSKSMDNLNQEHIYETPFHGALPQTPLSKSMDNLRSGSPSSASNLSDGVYEELTITRKDIAFPSTPLMQSMDNLRSDSPSSASNLSNGVYEETIPASSPASEQPPVRKKENDSLKESPYARPFDDVSSSLTSHANHESGSSIELLPTSQEGFEALYDEAASLALTPPAPPPSPTLPDLESHYDKLVHQQLNNAAPPLDTTSNEPLYDSLSLDGSIDFDQEGLYESSAPKHVTFAEPVQTEDALDSMDNLKTLLDQELSALQQLNKQTANIVDPSSIPTEDAFIALALQIAGHYISSEKDALAMDLEQVKNFLVSNKMISTLREVQNSKDSIKTSENSIDIKYIQPSANPSTEHFSLLKAGYNPIRNSEGKIISYAEPGTYKQVQIPLSTHQYQEELARLLLTSASRVVAKAL